MSTYLGIVKELAETRALLRSMAEQSAKYMRERDEANAELEIQSGYARRYWLRAEHAVSILREAQDIMEANNCGNFWGFQKRCDEFISGNPSPTKLTRIKLPPRRNTNTFASPESRYEDDGYDRAIEECAEALRAQGVEVEE